MPVSPTGTFKAITRQNFLEPFVILLREGSPTDPYLNITEKIKTVSMPTGLEKGLAVLREIPLYTQGVIATRASDGKLLEEIRDSLQVPNPDQFKVDYTNGRVYLDSVNNGEMITYTYKGRGVILVSGDRVILNNGQSSDYIKTLQDLVEEMESELLVGNLNNLLTIDKSYVVNALNEVFKMAKTPLNSTGVILSNDKLRAGANRTLIIPDLTLYFKDENEIGDMQVGVVISPTQTIDIPTIIEDGFLTYSIFIGIDGEITFEKGSPNRMYSNKILLGLVCLTSEGDLDEQFIFTSMQMANTDMLSRQEALLSVGTGSFKGGNIRANTGALTLNKEEYMSVGEGLEPADIDNPHLYIAEATTETQFYRFIPNGELNPLELELHTTIDPNHYVSNSVFTDVPSGKFTIQRYIELNNDYSGIVYGEQIFDSMDDALIAINQLEFRKIDLPHTETNRIVVQQGCTDLSNPVQCRIVYMNNSTAGGSGSSAHEQFSDRDFVLYNVTNTNKQLKFNLSGLAANVSRTLKPLDRSYTIADDADVQEIIKRNKIPPLTSGLVRSESATLILDNNTVTVLAEIYFQDVDKVINANITKAYPAISGYYTIYAVNDGSNINLTYLDDDLKIYNKLMVRLFKVKLNNGILDTSFAVKIPQLAQTSQLERTWKGIDKDKIKGGELKYLDDKSLEMSKTIYVKEGLSYIESNDKNVLIIETNISPLQLKYLDPVNGSFGSLQTKLNSNKYYNGTNLVNVTEGYYTIQRHILLCNGVSLIEYGTAQYKNLTEAKNSLVNQTFFYPTGDKGVELNRMIIQYINASTDTDLTDENQFQIFYTNNSGGIGGGVGSAMNVDEKTIVINNDSLLELKGTSELINNPLEYTKMLYTAVKGSDDIWYFNWEEESPDAAGHIIYSNDVMLANRSNLVFINYNDILYDDNINDSTIIDLTSMVTAFKYKGAVSFYDDTDE